ncbi:hypothetical protein RJ641_029311 [Dillenia turbinata]|uniref:Uncharacterized protein n=1 Tax=Dillenia turbinata TaxID=194707 RepID=A0AAN8ZMU9_9MAGN
MFHSEILASLLSHNLYWMCFSLRRKDGFPNNKQGLYEIWNNQAHYFRDNCHLLSPSYSNTMSMIHPNQSTVLHQQAPIANLKQELSCNNHHHHPLFLANQLIDLPKLDSPSLSPSLATLENDLPANDLEFYNDGRKNMNCSSTLYNDWGDLDCLVDSQISETTLSVLCPNTTNLPSPMMSSNTDNHVDFDTQGQISHHHHLGCFPNL